MLIYMYTVGVAKHQNQHRGLQVINRCCHRVVVTTCHDDSFIEGATWTKEGAQKLESLGV